MSINLKDCTPIDKEEARRILDPLWIGGWVGGAANVNSCDFDFEMYHQLSVATTKGYSLWLKVTRGSIAFEPQTKRLLWIQIWGDGLVQIQVLKEEVA